MQDVLYGIYGVLLLGSGLLIWPICALLWRKRKRRTRALRWVFFCEMACQLVLYGFMAFSYGILEHGYYWLMYMVLANLLFTLLAIGAAIHDYVASKMYAA